MAHSIIPRTPIFVADYQDWWYKNPSALSRFYFIEVLYYSALISDDNNYGIHWYCSYLKLIRLNIF